MVHHIHKFIEFLMEKEMLLVIAYMAPEERTWIAQEIQKPLHVRKLNLLTRSGLK